MNNYIIRIPFEREEQQMQLLAIQSLIYYWNRIKDFAGGFFSRSNSIYHETNKCLHRPPTNRSKLKRNSMHHSPQVDANVKNSSFHSTYCDVIERKFVWKKKIEWKITLYQTNVKFRWRMLMWWNTVGKMDAECGAKIPAPVKIVEGAKFSTVFCVLIFGMPSFCRVHDNNKQASRFSTSQLNGCLYRILDRVQPRHTHLLPKFLVEPI